MDLARRATMTRHISGRLGGERFGEPRGLRPHVPSRARASPVTHEIAGHLHPAARALLSTATSFAGPALSATALRLVLPAFGTYTGGLNVLDEAFAPLFGNDGVSVLVLGQEGLYPVATRLLRED